MSDFIRLPRSVLNSELWHDGNLARLFLYLLSKADENGEIQTDMAAIARDLVLSRQAVRTLMKKVESNQILTKSATTRTTKLKLDIQEDKPKRQPRRQPNQQPNTNQIKLTKFTPPSRQEAQAYIDKMGFHWGDADLFIDFNEQKGWRLSDGKPMQDWKAAMRNWENRWKQKYGNGAKTITEDKYTARRGTDVGNHTEADYGGPF